jgi:hypothetical protein
MVQKKEKPVANTTATADKKPEEAPANVTLVYGRDKNHKYLHNHANYLKLRN